MTEDISQRFVDFDLWSTKDAVEAMYEGQLFAIAAIQPAIEAIADAADAAALSLGTSGRLVYVGAGTSGRLAVQDGAELGPTFGWPKNRMIFCIAGGPDALTVSIEGAEDDMIDGATQIQLADVKAGDIVIGVAASGKTPFTLGALQEANTRGALTIGIANNNGTPLAETAQHPIVAITGSELLAGSTRMKAGSAQKAILNILSTAIMTRLGHVHKGLMVDMVVSNKKLEKRAINIIMDIADCTLEIATASLNTANKNIKAAILISLGETPEASLRILEQTNGNLGDALKVTTNSSSP
jgi:N-acetylmuramic acid 6-phosphate etherase